VLQHEDAVLNTFQKTSLRATLIAATLAALPLGAHAAGLGRISVLSALGQPLRAEIELTATAEELTSMSAEVAAPTAFKDAGIAYAPAVGTIRMAVERRGKRAFLRLTSTQAINDPFVDMLVELNWSAGRLLREYTFLLDPPNMPAPAAAMSTAGAPVAQAAARGARPIRPAAGAADGSYRVNRGDTLGKIARETKSANVSMDQMLVALYRANPEAFVDQNINRLRAGVILNVPDAQTAAAIPKSEARQQVIAHAADFNAYRDRVAARVAQSAPSEPAESSQASAGKITAKVEEAPSPVSESKDQVKVSRTETAEPASTADATALTESTRRLQALEEDVVARDKALAEANERLAALEKNIAELQKLIEMKNESLAALQKQAQGAEPAAPAAEPAPVAPAPAAEAMPVPAEAPAPVEAPSATAEDKPEAPMPAGAQDALDKELQDLVKPPAETAPVEPAPEAKPEPAPEPAPAPKVVTPPPAPVAEPSFLDSLMENPTTLYGGGAALLALLGFGLYRSRKSGKADTSGNETAMASVFPPDQNSVFGETGGQSVDTGSSSLIQTDFSQSGLSAIDADEGVDPVAEADVYMAYGRDAQAEEILLDAMKADPNRTAVHLKLLEIYAQRKNLKQFETTAAELYTVTNGQGEDWDKAVEMGLKLDPDNPLFSRAPVKEVGDEAEADAGFSAPPKDAGVAAAATAAAGAAALAAAAATVDTPEVSDEPPAATPDADIDADAEDLDKVLDFSTSIPSTDEPSPSQLKDTWAIPGDLNQFTDSDLERVADAAAPEAEGGQPGEGDEVTGLDTGDLDFNLDLDEPAAEAAPAPEAPAAKAAEDAAEAELDASFDAADSALEFNLDLDEAPPAGDSMAETRVTSMPEINLESTDTGTRSGIDFQSAFSHPETDEPLAEAETPDAGNVAVVDLEKTNFDGSLLDFDFELDESKGEGEQDMMATSLDLSDISLDLEGSEAAAPEDEPAPSLPEMVEEEAPSFELPEAAPAEPEAVPEQAEDSFQEQPPVQANDADDAMMASLTKSVVTSLTDSRAMPDLPADEELNQEVDTKLELARAYEEMGDAEGARELLDEVMRDGDAGQQEQARGILARLG
jgi:pilus assembly protein FimV